MKSLKITKAKRLTKRLKQIHNKISPQCRFLLSLISVSHNSCFVKKNRYFYMPYALVAGGSKGIGYAIAEALAKRRYDLVLIARDKQILDRTKEILEKRYGVRIVVMSKDLSLPESAKEVKEFCETNHSVPQVLCNVAGIGGTDDYLAAPLKEMRYMIHLNVESSMSLTYEILPMLLSHTPAYILNVGSMAGFAPIPVKNMYSATKSALISFSYALRSQLKREKISVSCLCPGPVFTKKEIMEYTIKKLGWFGKFMSMPPAVVGEIAVNNLLKKKFMIIPGLVPKVVSVFLRMLPIWLLIFIYDRLVEEETDILAAHKKHKE